METVDRAAKGKKIGQKKRKEIDGRNEELEWRLGTARRRE